MPAAEVSESVLRARAADGASADLLLVQPAADARDVLLWLPALGVAARNYLPLARALAAHGVATALHEWRGAGSSDQRATRACDWGYRELLAYDISASRRATRAAMPQARLWLGGHSLGGQLATLAAAFDPDGVHGMALVASGSPYWRAFRHAWLIRAAYTWIPWLAAICGYFPGRRIGFGGREARGVMTDWARSGRSGRYAAARMPTDFEIALSRVRIPVLALRLADDWLGPPESLDWLLRKMPAAPREIDLIAAEGLDGAPADHFAWMKIPRGVASRVASNIFEKQKDKEIL